MYRVSASPVHNATRCGLCTITRLCRTQACFDETVDRIHSNAISYVVAVAHTLTHFVEVLRVQRRCARLLRCGGRPHLTNRASGADWGFCTQGRHAACVRRAVEWHTLPCARRRYHPQAWYFEVFGARAAVRMACHV